MTGPPTVYSEEDCIGLVRALYQGFRVWSGEQGWMDITAEVEWAGEFNPRPMRTTRLGVLRRLDVVERHTRDAMAAINRAQKVSGQKPPQGWWAQLRQLTGSPAGYAAADQAGLSATPRTLSRWLSDPDYPIRSGDRAKIERAAAALQRERATQAQDRMTAAARAAADALSASVKARYGDEVRFFDVRNINFSDRDYAGEE